MSASDLNVHKLTVLRPRPIKVRRKIANCVTTVRHHLIDEHLVSGGGIVPLQ